MLQLLTKDKCVGALRWGGPYECEPLEDARKLSANLDDSAYATQDKQCYELVAQLAHIERATIG